jgi:uncharacterized iron-regulated protein
MSHSLRRVFFIAALLLSLPILAEAVRPKEQSGGEPEASDTFTAVVDLKALSTMDQLIEKLASKQVIFIGESHDRYEDHLDQLAVIEGLHKKGRDLAIGMEMFQQPFQSYLDAYVKGEISEKELLRKTEWFDRWRFDYRLYRPILRFARGHRIPLVALNLEREITGKVGKGGLGSLSPQERARIPSDIDRDDQDYRERIKTVFEQHPGADKKDFERFLEVQLLWDEGMAERAAAYLREHPEKTLIVLAGTGHLEYGQGIPRRLLRRVPAESAILLDGKQRGPDPEIADFMLYSQPVPLPASGQLGVLLDADCKGEGVAIKGFAESSGAEDTGMKEGDRILAVGGDPVAFYSDIRIALLGRRPGEKLSIEVLRKHLLRKDERLTFEVQLH